MARGQTLESILTKVRAKARLSLLPAANTQARDGQVIRIQQVQQRLWDGYNWPHMRIEHTLPLQAGQYLYDLPETDAYTLSMDRVEYVAVRDGGEWVRLCADITDANYTIHETQLDERAWPVRNWRASPNDEIEVWPIPDQNADATTLEGYLKVVAIRNLDPLVEDSDRADLDDELIALLAAAEILQANGAADAKVMMAEAERRYQRLTGNQTKIRSFRLFGAGRRPERPRRPVIGRYE